MRRLALLLIALPLALGGGWAATAQDTENGTSVTPATVELPSGCEVDANQALALCVRRTIVGDAGQFAGVTVHLQVADEGWVQLTRCDDVIVLCGIEYLRMEDAVQGDVFVLAPPEGE